MKTVKFIKQSVVAAFVVAAVALSGCDDKPETIETPVITVTGNPPRSQTLEAEQTSAGSITFTTTAAWTSTIKAGEETATWLRITPANGDKAGEYIVSFALDANTTPEARTAIVTFTCGDTETTFSITQKGTSEEQVTGKKITFAVRECNTEWSPFNGTDPFFVSAGVTLAIYKDGAEVAAAGTDAAGKVEIQLPEGEYTYLATATNGALHIHKPADSDVGSIAVGMVIDEETDGMYRDALLGTIKYADINGDGRITDEDFVQRALLTVTADAEEAVYIMQPAAAIYPQYLLLAHDVKTESAFKHIFNYSYRMDAALTHEANTHTNWVNFQYDAADDAINVLWNASYNTVTLANRLLDMIPKVFAEGETDLAVEARARYQRAYAYQVLLTYFGDVPITSAIWMANMNEPRNTELDVARYIMEECDWVAANYVETTDNWDAGSRAAAQQLKARTAMHIKEYATAQRTLDAIIQSGQFNLSLEWGGDALCHGALIVGLPLKGDPNGAVYPARYAETLLLQTEAMLMQNNTNEALMYLNLLLLLKGQQPMTTANTSDEILAAGVYSWRTLLNLEGHTFAWMKRAGIFLTEMSEYGALAKHLLLPIPQSAIDANPNLTQNTGW